MAAAAEAPNHLATPWKLEGGRIKLLHCRPAAGGAIGGRCASADQHRLSVQESPLLLTAAAVAIAATPSAGATKGNAQFLLLDHLRHHHSVCTADWTLASDWRSEASSCYRGDWADSAKVEEDLHKRHIFLPEEGPDLPQLRPGGSAMLQQEPSARYPKPSAQQPRLPRSEEEQRRCPWHAFWTASEGGRVLGADGVWSDVDAEGSEDRRRLMARQAAQLREREWEGTELARQRRQEHLETHFLFGRGDPGCSDQLKSTFGDTYGRDDTVTQIRNVYDARRFLEADAAATAAAGVTAGVSATARLATSATAASACFDLRRSNWMPMDFGERVYRPQPSIYKKDFNLEKYSRPYIHPPMKDSGLLPQISDAHKLGGVTQSCHPSDLESGIVRRQRPDGNRAARVSGNFCFIGGPALGRADNAAGFRSGNQKRSGLLAESSGAAVAFRFGETELAQL